MVVTGITPPPPVYGTGTTRTDRAKAYAAQVEALREKYTIEQQRHAARAQELKAPPRAPTGETFATMEEYKTYMATHYPQTAQPQEVTATPVAAPTPAPSPTDPGGGRTTERFTQSQLEQARQQGIHPRQLIRQPYYTTATGEKVYERVGARVTGVTRETRIGAAIADKPWLTGVQRVAVEAEPLLTPEERHIIEGTTRLQVEIAPRRAAEALPESIETFERATTAFKEEYGYPEFGETVAPERFEDAIAAAKRLETERVKLMEAQRTIAERTPIETTKVEVKDKGPIIATELARMELERQEAITTSIDPETIAREFGTTVLSSAAIGTALAGPVGTIPAAAAGAAFGLFDIGAKVATATYETYFPSEPTVVYSGPIRTGKYTVEPPVLGELSPLETKILFPERKLEYRIYEPKEKFEEKLLGARLTAAAAGFAIVPTALPKVALAIKETVTQPIAISIGRIKVTSPIATKELELTKTTRISPRLKDVGPTKTEVVGTKTGKVIVQTPAGPKELKGGLSYEKITTQKIGEIKLPSQKSIDIKLQKFYSESIKPAFRAEVTTGPLAPRPAAQISRVYGRGVKIGDFGVYITRQPTTQVTLPTRPLAPPIITTQETKAFSLTRDINIGGTQYIKAYQAGLVTPTGGKAIPLIRRAVAQIDPSAFRGVTPKTIATTLQQTRLEVITPETLVQVQAPVQTIKPIPAITLAPTAARTVTLTMAPQITKTKQVVTTKIEQLKKVVPAKVVELKAIQAPITKLEKITEPTTETSRQMVQRLRIKTEQLTAPKVSPAVMPVTRTIPAVTTKPIVTTRPVVTPKVTTVTRTIPFRPTPTRITFPTITPVTPTMPMPAPPMPLPIAIGIGAERVRRPKTIRIKYETHVKVGGEFRKLGVARPKGIALKKGTRFTGRTPARTFKIVPVGLTREKDITAQVPLEKFYAKKGTYIERVKYAIDEPGEFIGITLKGIRAPRKKKRKKKRGSPKRRTKHGKKKKSKKK